MWPEAGVKVVGGSVGGLAHELRGLPNQDALGWRFVSDTRTLIAVVADGAGSAACGGEGARFVVSELIRSLSSPSIADNKNLPQADGALLVSHLLGAREHLTRLAELEKRPAKDYACTVLACLLTPDGAWSAQIGDGAIVLGAPAGPSQALHTSQQGEYVNETVFLTSDQAVEHIKSGYHPGPHARLAMFTDGLQRIALKLPEGQPHEPFFKPLFQFLSQCGDAADAVEQITGFLKSPRIRSRADDDLSLLLAQLDWAKPGKA